MNTKLIVEDAEHVLQDVSPDLKAVIDKAYRRFARRFKKQNLPFAASEGSGAKMSPDWYAAISVLRQLLESQFQFGCALTGFHYMDRDAVRIFKEQKRTIPTGDKRKHRAWCDQSFGDYLAEVDRILETKYHTTSKQIHIDYIAICQEQRESPAHCAYSIAEGTWEQSQ